MAITVNQDHQRSDLKVNIQINLIQIYLINQICFILFKVGRCNGLREFMIEAVVNIHDLAYSVDRHGCPEINYLK